MIGVGLVGKGKFMSKAILSKEIPIAKWGAQLRTGAEIEATLENDQVRLVCDGESIYLDVDHLAPIIEILTAAQKRAVSHG